MATTLAPQPADSVLPAPVRHPLARLRRTIQYYVLAEGLLLLGVVLASLWWVGLVVDYGLFVLTGSESWRYLFGSVGIRTGVLDWVQVLPMWLRVGLLGLVVLVALTVVIRYVVLRLVREFSVTSLALLLEQKFPALLGDRLITAVELADQRRAAEQGYSWAMVEKTIAEAEQAVSQVPIGSIFNWGRLRRLGAILLGLTLGLVGLVGVGGGCSPGRRPGPWPTGAGTSPPSTPNARCCCGTRPGRAIISSRSSNRPPTRSTLATTPPPASRCGRCPANTSSPTLSRRSATGRRGGQTCQSCPGWA
jgi:hypothetical protein